MGEDEHRTAKRRLRTSGFLGDVEAAPADDEGSEPIEELSQDTDLATIAAAHPAMQNLSAMPELSLSAVTRCGDEAVQ